jgi:predicted NAD/FAD-binding protein
VQLFFIFDQDIMMFDQGPSIRLPLTNRARQRIAVVGSGIAGLSAAWLLSRRHEVTVFEANDYLGGHTHSVDVTLDGVSHPVDTGFLVFNHRTYPNLTAMFSHLGVDTAPSDMSFGVSIGQGQIEWAGSSLASVFAQPANLARPAFWGMLADIARFNREATRLAAVASQDTAAATPLGEFLERGGYGHAFRDWYLLPMAGAIWSCPTQTMLGYPVSNFARFCHNHGLLQVANRPQWHTVRGSAREYVRRMSPAIRSIRLQTAVRSIRAEGGTVSVHTRDGTESFDQAILACHSDQALALLGAGASEAERRVLGGVSYQNNRAVLHFDTALLPRRRAVWSAWNYIADSAGAAGAAPVGVSYLINRLQPLPFTQPVIVTLNPPRAADARKVIAEFEYEHPVFDCAAVAAQHALPAIQGQRGLWFCGAWAGYGFHEDGLKAGLAVANALGEFAPWQQPAGALQSAPGARGIVLRPGTASSLAQI